MLEGIWSPAGVTYKGSTPAQFPGSGAFDWELCPFEFHYKDQYGVDHYEKVIIPRTPDISKAHVVDMAAQGYENFVNECKQKYTKRAPNAEEKKQIGKALKETKTYKRKRLQSTNKKIYY